MADIRLYAGTGQVCGCELPYRRKHHQGDAGPCRDANASCVPCSSRVGCGLQPILVYRSKRTDGPKRKGALEQIMERVELAKTNPAFPPILIFPCVLPLCCATSIGLNPHRIHIHTPTHLQGGNNSQHDGSDHVQAWRLCAGSTSSARGHQVYV